MTLKLQKKLSTTNNKPIAYVSLNWQEKGNIAVRGSTFGLVKTVIHHLKFSHKLKTVCFNKRINFVLSHMKELPPNLSLIVARIPRV